MAMFLPSVCAPTSDKPLSSVLLIAEEPPQNFIEFLVAADSAVEDLPDIFAIDWKALSTDVPEEPENEVVCEIKAIVCQEFPRYSELFEGSKSCHLYKAMYFRVLNAFARTRAFHKILLKHFDELDSQVRIRSRLHDLVVLKLADAHVLKLSRFLSKHRRAVDAIRDGDEILEVSQELVDFCDNRESVKAKFLESKSSEYSTEAEAQQSIDQLLDNELEKEFVYRNYKFLEVVDWAEGALQLWRYLELSKGALESRTNALMASTDDSQPSTSSTNPSEMASSVQETAVPSANPIPMQDIIDFVQNTSFEELDASIASAPLQGPALELEDLDKLMSSFGFVYDEGAPSDAQKTIPAAPVDVTLVTTQDFDKYMQGLGIGPGDVESQVHKLKFVDLGTRLLATQDPTKEHETELLRIAQYAKPILGRFGGIFDAIGREKAKLTTYSKAMLRKDQKVLVTRLKGLKSDGGAYIRQLAEVIQSFNAAQRWHNLLLEEVAQLEQLRKPQSAESKGSSQPGSPMQVEGPTTQGAMSSPPPTSPIEGPPPKRRKIAFAAPPPLGIRHLESQLWFIEVEMVKLWDRQIHDTVLAQNTLYREFDALMTCIREHVQKYPGKEVDGGPETTLVWAAKNFDISPYDDYPLEGVKLELRTDLLF
ncbi:hypothetical protein TWF281_008674 [Arthrobotrys megalospora]